MESQIATWTALFVALTTLVIAVLRRDTMSDNHVTLLTLVVVTVFFFLGRALDGALAWPLPQSMAGELAQALIAQQVIYLLVKKTSPVKALEKVGNT
jgi:4-amino-4-deoxy-L-arabinose transferase-like glycosyltransferase